MTKAKVINEFDYGVLVWYTADGRLVKNDNDDVMYIPIENIKDRIEVSQKIHKLKTAAAGFGFANGHANFWSGHRAISDEEYENQLQRQEAGLVPDIYDQGAINDELRTVNK